MAMIPTHIRFALDVLDLLPITNVQHYISGTVYPDSRWVTGIDRELTHHSRFMQPDFPKDDFTFGWFVHCCCDELQKELHHSLFDDLDTMEQLDRWILLSAAKVIQDRNDLQFFNLKEMLGHLEYVRNPNDESLELVTKFYQIIKRTYSSSTTPSPEDYGDMWLSVGLNSQTTERLLKTLSELMKNQQLVQQIELSHTQAVSQFRESYSNHLK